MGFDQVRQVGDDGLAVLRIVQAQVDDPVSFLAQRFGEGAHGREKSQKLLEVMPDVVGFLANLHQDVDHRRIHAAEPGVAGIELVAQDQPQGARRRHGDASGVEAVAEQSCKLASIIVLHPFGGRVGARCGRVGAHCDRLRRERRGAAGYDSENRRSRPAADGW